MRRSRTRATLLTPALSATVGFAGCSSSSKDTEAAASGESAAVVAAPSGDKPTIKLVENAWTASVIDVEIVKQLIETNLGNKVEVVKIDENLQFAGLAAGDLDATLEIWPSCVVPEEQKYIDDGQLVNAGPLGAVGKIGWFVPDYVEEEFPQLKTWEGFKDPAVAKTFVAAETGVKGRFLGTDPSYSQYDETIVKNLGLPSQVQFSGSEAARVAELETKDAAVAALEENFSLSTGDQLSMLPTVEIDKKPVADVAAEWISANQATWKAWLA